MVYSRTVDGGSSTQSLLQGSHAASSQAVSVDFKSLLGSLFTKSLDFVRDYADPAVTNISVEGYGTYDDKDSPAFQLVASMYLSNMENQLTTMLNIMENIYKTWPQKIENMF